ncbi:hypothetical protein [Bacillus sp. AFS041924]|uniref:hypothetical protein n=1 Tax=Bacillus sp. AFS041924 TaxID=2033503 RepID=UPI000BFBAF14|nr:hypothetical protein [Bacillus sp. AFS041924]PGS55099.1 hypothetical protein COC46_04025 [Bacillus sp. AFS041924]
MKTIEQIKELVTKAQDLQHNSTKEYRVLQDAFNLKKSEIQLNRDYTLEGKKKLTDSLRSKKTIELMQLSRNQSKMFKELLNEAKKEAENIVHSKSPKVDPVKEERFKQRLAEVKTEVLLSDAKKGKQILSDFLKTVDEQAFASEIKNEFSALVGPILADAGQDAREYRIDLSKMFEEVKVRSMSPEALEAMRIAEYAGAAIGNDFFLPIVVEKSGENLGELASKFVNKPEQYFELFPEDAKYNPNGLKTMEEINEERDAMIE